MTTYESIMLAVCFGAVVGSFIGNLICLIKYSIEERKLKKQLNWHSDTAAPSVR